MVKYIRENVNDIQIPNVQLEIFKDDIRDCYENTEGTRGIGFGKVLEGIEHLPYDKKYEIYEISLKGKKQPLIDYMLLQLEQTPIDHYENIYQGIVNSREFKAVKATQIDSRIERFCDDVADFYSADIFDIQNKVVHDYHLWDVVDEVEMQVAIDMVRDAVEYIGRNFDSEMITGILFSDAEMKRIKADHTDLSNGRRSDTMIEDENDFGF